MSLSWRERLHVALHPDQVAVLRLGRGYGRRVLERRLFPLTEGEAPAAGFARALAAFPGARRAVTVILSNALTHYALLPWQAELNREAELEAYARHAFVQIHGERAAHWSLRWSPGPLGGDYPACALDASLLEGLRAACQAAGQDLVSVQPYWMAVFNRYRRRLGQGPVWLLLQEPGRLLLSHLEGGAWRWLKSHRLNGTGEEAAILARDALLSGRAPGRLLLHAGQGPAWDGRLEGWRPERLDVPGEAGYALAELA